MYWPSICLGLCSVLFPSAAPGGVHHHARLCRRLKIETSEAVSLHIYPRVLFFPGALIKHISVKALAGQGTSQIRPITDNSQPVKKNHKWMVEKRNEQKITFSFKHAIDLQMYVCSILIWANDTINSSEMAWNCGSWQQTGSKMKQEVRFQLYCFIIFYYFLPLSFLLICLYFLPSILLQFHLCKNKKILPS